MITSDNFVQESERFYAMTEEDPEYYELHTQLMQYGNTLGLGNFGSINWWKKFGTIPASFMQKYTQNGFATKPGQWYACFAIREGYGLQSWILTEDERWHDVVRGDGGSYRQCGLQNMSSEFAESYVRFQERVDLAVKKYMEEGMA